MLRSILKWRIGSSIERNAPLPPWLSRRADRDPELLEYERASRQLCRRLRADASAWLDRQSTPPAVVDIPSPLAAARRRRPAASRRLAWPTARYALAVAAIAAIGGYWKVSTASKEARLQELQAVQAAVVADSQWLASAWKAGRADVEQLNSRLNQMPQHVATLKKRGMSTIAAPAQSARATAGRIIAALDAGVASQRRDLAADMNAAGSFFAYRLPSSAAKMIGL